MRNLISLITTLAFSFSSVSFAAQPPVMKDGIDVRKPIILKDQTSIATPPSGFKALGSKTDGKLYIKDSSGVEKPVGSGDGSGINSGYLVNGSFDDSVDSTTGWTLGSGVTKALALDHVEGAQAVTLSFTSLNGPIIDQCLTTPTSLTGQTMGYEIQVKTSTANLQACSMRDNAEIQCADVASDGNWHKILFNYPGSGSINDCVKVKTTTSTTGSVAADAGYLGLARNLAGGLISNPVYLQAYTSGTQSLGNATWTKITSFTTPINNIGSIWDATNKRAVIKYPGEYLITLNGEFASSSSGARVFQLYVNGAGAETGGAWVNNGDTVAQGRTYHLKLNENDYIEAYAYQSSGSSLNLTLARLYVSRLDSNQSLVTQNPVSDFGRIFPWLNATCPANSEPLDGGTTTNTALISFLGSSTRPDWRALYPRMAGSQTISGVAHAGGSVGDKYNDQMQGHKHTTGLVSSVTGELPFGNAGSGYGVAGSTGDTRLRSLTSGVSTTDGTNGTPRTGSETRPPTVVVNYCISTATMSAPLVLNSVKTSDSAPEGLARVTMTTPCTVNGACATSSKSTAITSVTRSAQGSYTVAIASGFFSSTPTCVCTAHYATTPANAWCEAVSSSATSIAISTTHTSGTLTGDNPFQMICVGPTQ